MKKLVIGWTVIKIWEEEKAILVKLPCGREIAAAPEDNDEYRKRAYDHGYGEDTWQMCKDHEIGHVLLSWWALRGASRTLTGVLDKRDGVGNYWPHWAHEEAAVLAFQRFVTHAGTTVEAIAIGA